MHYELNSVDLNKQSSESSCASLAGTLFEPWIYYSQGMWPAKVISS
uniref:Uncharacterized protein n=1 Tax=Arundo donax TaxID=35708 RepID=A0A0A8ZBQ5_ARUDO